MYCKDCKMFWEECKCDDEALKVGLSETTCCSAAGVSEDIQVAALNEMAVWADKWGVSLAATGCINDECPALAKLLGM